ncbi:MAG: alpha-amylase family glycosyl hydrolase [Silvania sp.]|uniref:alpha-amylase family glycosyl hydrolase n=1 Tax=Silvania sp. TaxID=3016633 RepID=UPI003EE58AE7
MNTNRWWQDAVFYQIYLPSFCDGNGDGLGDFTGLLTKIDYLATLGVGAVWITPFYPSPLVDNGYDISDFCAVDPRFGQLADFERVVEACHRKGIRVVIDLVINHVSSQHPWFVDAWNNPASRYRDYFIFTSRPNNWRSFFSGSAWEKEPDTGEYYYHKFAPEQVDLNWRNPEVEKEILRVIDFWRERGVDGFRFDVINFLTTDGVGEDNPERDGEQDHLHDINQPALLPTLRRLCRYIRERGDYLLIGEIGSEALAVLSCYQADDLMDVVFNFNLGSLKCWDLDAIVVQLQAMREQQSGLPTLFFSSHDMPRMIGRFGEGERDVERAAAVAALQLTAFGMPFIYQGEEAGIGNYSPCTERDIYDIQGKTWYHTALAQGMTAAQALEQAITHSRDASRAPLPWNSQPFAGFSCVPPWMPLRADFPQVNIDAQMAASDSLWHVWRRLIALRKTSPALRHGAYRLLAKENDALFFMRESAGESVWVAINFGEPARNLWHEIPAQTVYGADDLWIQKNQCVIKRSSHGKAQ